MTAAFGRGTDFIVLNQDLNKMGGVHVIHAFLCTDESEEVQVKGRTARQSNEGSYEAIIDDNTLEQLDTNGNDVRNSGNIHEFLKDKRSVKAEAEFKDTEKMLKESDEKHDLTTKTLGSNQLNQASIIDYVYKLN